MITLVPPTRPVKTASHVHLQGGTPMCLCVGGMGVSKSYFLKPIPSDFGRAFQLEPRAGGPSYAVLLDGRDSVCGCKGFEFTGGCKHLSALLSLVAQGRL